MEIVVPLENLESPDRSSIYNKNSPVLGVRIFM
jgi:hypothetical protein